MIHKIRLIFGIVLCAVLMSGCLPVPGTITYWDEEIDGQIMTAGGEPISGATVSASCGLVKSQAASDGQGKFQVSPIRHRYFIQYWGGVFPDAGTGDKDEHTFSDRLNLVIDIPERNMKYMISWYVMQLEGESICLFFCDFNKPLKNDPSDRRYWEPPYTSKFEFDSSVPPADMAVGDDKIRVVFFPALMKQIQKNMVPNTPANQKRRELMF